MRKVRDENEARDGGLVLKLDRYEEDAKTRRRVENRDADRANPHQFRLDNLAPAEPLLGLPCGLALLLTLSRLLRTPYREVRYLHALNKQIRPGYVL
jgi:hypothetical protein